MTNLLCSKEDEALDDPSGMAAVISTNQTLTFNRASLTPASYQSQDPRSCLRNRAPFPKTSSTTAFTIFDFWPRDEAVRYSWRLVPTISRNRRLPSLKKCFLPLPQSTSLSVGCMMMNCFELSMYSKTVSWLLVFGIMLKSFVCVLWCCRLGGLSLVRHMWTLCNWFVLFYGSGS